MAERKKRFNFFGILKEETKSKKSLESEFQQAVSKTQGENDVHDTELSLALIRQKKSNGGWWNSMIHLLPGGPKDDANDAASLFALIESARDHVSRSGDAQDNKQNNNKSLDSFQKELKTIMGQLSKMLVEAGLLEDGMRIDPGAVLCYLEQQDEKKKDPSWKRQMHDRFQEQALDSEVVYELHDALYLAELGYVDTVQEIQEGLSRFEGQPYELIYATVDSLAHEPAHFLAMKKEGCVEILLVVRGTKDLGDMLSDALLEASDFQDGKAHDGIARSGRWLVDKHIDLLRHIQKESRSKIKLRLVGHSLGAGTAAIACLLFNQECDFVEATSVGFGCPALLSKKLSLRQVDAITTVVNDSDCVPRMSGATICNALLDMMSVDVGEKAAHDIQHLMDAIPIDVPKNDIANWVRGEINKHTTQSREMASRTPRQEVILYPPGKCIHLFRDSVGITATFISCDFFSELDVTRTMVDDHLIPQGYNRVFLELMRHRTSNPNFQFRHDVNSLRFEKKKQEEPSK